MSEALLRSLVWLDFRLAVLFTVLLPLVLLIWAFVQKNEAIQRLLIIYWRVSSLLAVTVYLLIGGALVSFLSGPLARVLIPISLWFWVDLNEEISEQRRSPLKLAFTAWRWAVSVYCVLGVLGTLPFLQCAFSRATFSTPFCQVWAEPPLLYKQFFHAGSTPQFLGFLGILGLGVYVLCLLYFVIFRLGKQGRSALEQ
ncbi:DUF3177 family protein [Microcoleus sp. FACHB-1515]|uniref:DUF3177 family protein n=1 Tax=Cyanophyceae TaxID=3028117 RepID=UPI0016860714|nr:DUF3177 family protein [Microcoleus sp. FACHB-1515]MBD2089732.1 DUF3177 family protein [Microcoleus sp. FACHB-1515]